MTTDTERWRRIRALVETAMELSGAERERWIADSCGGDDALRREIDELLAHDVSEESSASRASSWSAALGDLRSIPESVVAALAADTPGRVEGMRIGAYSLVSEIGSGGMGKVYLAERDDAQYRKRVAIKVIKRGMDSDDILRRFKNERQILADLEHENIARLLDGGSTDGGQPYLVLEYVDGVPIDRWCDERRATIRERIVLFLAVCSAVEYAHERRAVHRDIKPSNILVTKSGVPKLLDFGIAKLVGAEDGDLTAQFTSTSERRLTPAYASPEQIRGEPITPASDVFSLGVVLYELMTGEKPFDARDRTAESAPFERPEKPSTIAATARPATCDARRADASALRRTLAGDLDTIVLKAMHADAARRYPSASALSDDLRRHLTGRTVSARPDSLSYRASKFVKRNKLIVGATLTILLALAIGFATSTVLYFKAVDVGKKLAEKTSLAESRLHDAELAQAAERVQRELAEQRFSGLRDLATTFIFDVHTAIEPLQGSLPARQLIVKTATQYLERLASEKKDDAELQLQLAQAWLRIGEIQSSHGKASYGAMDAALANLRRARAIAAELARADPSRTEKNILFMTIDLRIAEIDIRQHRLDEARSRCEAVVAAVDRLTAEHREARPYQRVQLHAHMRLGEAQSRLGELASSLENYRAALAISEDLARVWVGDDDVQGTFGNSLQQLGNILEKNGRLDEAVDAESRALTVFEQLDQRDPTRAMWRREAAVCRSGLARMYDRAGCTDEARAEARRALDTMIALWSGDAANASAQADVASMYVQFANFQIDAGDMDDAIRFCRAAVDSIGDLVRRSPDDLDLRHKLAAAQSYMATALAKSGRIGDALRALHDARSILEELAEEQSSALDMHVELFYCSARLGHVYASAAAASASGDARASNLRAACKWLQLGVDGLSRLSACGAASSVGDVRLEEFEADLVRCTADLAAMRERASDDAGAPVDRGIR
jgi:serine/threonine protein kinase